MAGWQCGRQGSQRRQADIKAVHSVRSVRLVCAIVCCSVKGTIVLPLLLPAACLSLCVDCIVSVGGRAELTSPFSGPGADDELLTAAAANAAL